DGASAVEDWPVRPRPYAGRRSSVRRHRRNSTVATSAGLAGGAGGGVHRAVAGGNSFRQVGASCTGVRRGSDGPIPQLNKAQIDKTGAKPYDPLPAAPGGVRSRRG